MKKTLFLAAVIALLPCLAGASQDTQPLLLEEVIKEAREKNPEITAAKEKWQASVSRQGRVSGLPDPQAGFMWEQIPSGTFSFGEAMPMYSFSQMIPFPGKLVAEGRIAKAAAEMDRSAWEAKVREINARTKTVYYDLYYAHRAIQINRENKELLKRFVNIAEVKYSVGKAAQYDILRARVERDILENDLIALELEKESVEAKLNALLNRPVDSRLGVPEEWELNSFDLEYGKLAEIALRNRPELKEASSAVEKSSHALGLAGSQYLPDFMLTYKNRLGMGWDAEVMFSFPLWFWKQSSGVKEAASEKLRADASYQAMKNTVLAQVKAYIAKVQSGRRLVNLFKTSIVPQTTQTLEAAIIGYQNDKIDFLTLINTQRMFQDVKLKYWKAIVVYSQNLAELEQILGVDAGGLK